MKSVSFTPAATRQWFKLSADIRKRLDTKLTIYATNRSGDLKRLKGTEGCRLRIGDWRVIFVEDARSIIVIAVGNRGAGGCFTEPASEICTGR
jgi:mRNA interferase RelE/StbE